MSRKPINSHVERELWVESMGRCMNPDCQAVLFFGNTDIIEKAHIQPYSINEDNSFENLVILCPNCHKKFDKAHLISVSDIHKWKSLRHAYIEKIFAKKFSSFDELKRVIRPLLLENKGIYENYYVNNNKLQWDAFEKNILLNNEQLKMILLQNLQLIQYSKDEHYSNVEVVRNFIQHVNEFRLSRGSTEKVRGVLFPEKLNSIFGVAPIEGPILPMTESLESLLNALHNKGVEVSVKLGVDKPYIMVNEDGSEECIYLDDTPRIRQMYHDNNSFRKTKVRLESLNFALKLLRRRHIKFNFWTATGLTEIKVNETHVYFVYEYCLSKEFLMRLDPDENSMVVNLHNWNGELCISDEAFRLAEDFNVTLLTTEDYQKFVRKQK